MEEIIVLTESKDELFSSVSDCILITTQGEIYLKHNGELNLLLKEGDTKFRLPHSFEISSSLFQSFLLWANKVGLLSDHS